MFDEIIINLRPFLSVIFIDDLRLVSKVPPEAERQVILNVAANIFEDGVFNWGRVVALFYFAYKVCVKVSTVFFF